ncbi:hypothetical protein FACS1894125_2540 [Actinomycetota bacterium]|nr:hypothetical protein FACS1894125_2540 [Actinomycetota bacterium]
MKVKRSNTFTVGDERTSERRRMGFRALSFGAGIAFAGAVIVLIAVLTSPISFQKPEQLATDVWVRNNSAGLYGNVNLGSLELKSKQSIEKSTPFYNGDVVRGNQANYLFGSGEIVQINEANPTNINAQEKKGFIQVAQGASNVITNGEWAVLIGQDGKIYKAKTSSIEKTSLVSNPDSKAIATNISKSGEVIVLYDTGEVWKIENGKEAKQSKYSISTENDKLIGNFSITFSNDNWAVFLEGTQKDSQLWVNGEKSEDKNNQIKLTLPTEDQNIYYETPSKVIKISKDGKSEVFKELEQEYTPAAIFTNNSKCFNGEAKIIAVWEGVKDIVSSVCGNFEVLPYSKPTNESNTIMGRGINLSIVNDFVVLNAQTTGEVWLMKDDDSTKWTVVKSTLNNWQTELDKKDTIRTQQTPDKNLCPTIPETQTFGVRPGKDNRVPVLLPVLDANQGDVLSIVGDVETTNADLGTFRVVDNGQALAVDVSENSGAPRSTQVTIHVTDGGADEAGFCQTAITYTVEEHLYSDPNQPPKHIGADIPYEHLNVAPYPASTTVDSLTGWYDPDGDNLFAIASSLQDRGRAVIGANGQLTFQAENVAPGESQNVGYIVQDDLGAKVPTATVFQVVESGAASLDTITRSMPVNQQQKINMAENIHGTSASWILNLLNIPDGLSAKVSPEGQEVFVTASKQGEFTMNYTISNETKMGSIHIVSYDENSSRKNFTVNPMSVVIPDEEDVVVDINSAVQNMMNSRWEVKDVKVFPKREESGNVLADISADVLSGNKVKLDGFLTSNTASSYVLVGKAILSIGIDGADDVTATIDIAIAKISEAMQPIAVPDQVSVHPGETVDIDVLTNDVATIGQSLRIDPRTADEENISKQGFAYPCGDKIRYIAPTNATVGDVLSRDYWIYSSGHTQTQRAHGYINIVIVDPSIDLPTSYSGTKSPEDDKNALENQREAQNTGQIKPVGFRDIEYLAQGEETTINPLDNDVIPSGQYAKVVNAKQVSNVGASQDISNVEITDEDKLQQLHLKVGETGDQTIWELTVETYSTGSLAKYGPQNSKVTTYSERVVLRTALEKSIPTYPMLNDIKVKTSQIEHRSIFKTNVEKAFVSTQNPSDFNLSLIIGSDIDIKDTNFSGKVHNQSQVVLYKAEMKNSDILTYGFVRVPSIDSVVPTRKNNALKTAQVGQEPLRIDVVNEIEPLQDSALVISGDIVHEAKRPQSTCQLQQNTLVYTPNSMRSELKTDTDTYDSCSIWVNWDGSEKTRTLIEFQINIIPEKTIPEIKDNVSLADLAPKEQSTTSLREYLTWYGHSDEDIANLQLSCTIDEEITVSCSSQNLTLEVPRTAKELVTHTIRIQMNNSEAKAVNWTLRVKAGVKRGDIQIPVRGETLIIKEKQAPPTVNVLDDVKSWLSRPEFYDFQQGGTISCAPNQDPKVHCLEVGGTGSGTLSFTIVAAAEDTGFMTQGNYVFTDRAPDNSPNRGSGTIKIEYQALPKQPPQPELNMELAKKGILEFTVSEGSATIPEATQICITIDGAENCKPHNGQGSVKFSTAAELSSLAKWKQYSFAAVVKNEVGSSPPSISVAGTPFTEIVAPDVKWHPNSDGSISIDITKADPETEKFLLSWAGNTQEIPKSSDDLTSYSISGLQPLETLPAVSVQAISHNVTSGKESFVASKSEVKSVHNLVVPLLRNISGELTVKYEHSTNSITFDLSHILSSLPIVTGVKYEYIFNGTCGDIGWGTTTSISCTPSETQDYNQNASIRAVFVPSAFGGEVDGDNSEHSLDPNGQTVSGKGRYVKMPSEGDLSNVHYCIAGSNYDSLKIEISGSIPNSGSVSFSVSPAQEIPVKPTSSIEVKVTVNSAEKVLNPTDGKYPISAGENCASYKPTFEVLNPPSFLLSYDRNNSVATNITDFTPASAVPQGVSWKWYFKGGGDYFKDGDRSSGDKYSTDVKNVEGDVGRKAGGELSVCIKLLEDLISLPEKCFGNYAWSFEIKDTTPKPKCTIPGKTSLDADSPDCKADPVTPPPDGGGTPTPPTPPTPAPPTPSVLHSITLPAEEGLQNDIEKGTDNENK